jgi:hypothetical protein
MAHRKDASTLSSVKLTALRALLDTYITKPTDNPVAEHKAAGMDMSLMIHAQGFLVWHQHFVAELETWLVNNGGATFVPLSLAMRASGEVNSSPITCSRSSCARV